MHSGSSQMTMAPKTPGLVTSIGIASLILEGRSHCCDDEDEGSNSSDEHHHHPPRRLSTEPTFSGTNSIQTILSLAATNQVPCGLDLANQPQSSTSSKGVVYQSLAQLQPSCSRSSTASVPQDDDTLQRLRQKLMLIRSAPGTSRDAIQQSIAVPSGSASFYAGVVDSDDDLDAFFPEPISTASVAHQQRESGCINSLMTLATNTCLNTTPRSFGRMPDLMDMVDAWTASGYVSQTASSNTSFAASTPTPSGSARAGSCCFETPPKAQCKKSNPNNNTNNKNVGPHCEEFMKKIGLIKSAKDAASSTSSSTNTTPIRTKASPAVAYVEEHVCVLTRKTCIMWKTKCMQMEWIYMINQPICIEVYLGPEHHAILLEQWIIERGERTNQMTMTLPSLCSAIRSQLYFSQISAWTEQLKSTASSVSATTTTTPLNPRIKPNHKLDILYRIRPFDHTSYFNGTPNTHNFPDTVVADGQVIKVCLKSLPRRSAIPTLQQQQPLVQSTVPTASSSTSASSAAPLPDRQPHMCTETGKHRCGSFEEDESSTDMDTSSCSPVVDSPLTTHRNRQLEKYRRRLQKRDHRKKKESDVVDEMAVDGVVETKCINSIRPPLYAGFGQSPAKQLTPIPRHRQSSSSSSLTSVGTQTDDPDSMAHQFRSPLPNFDDESSIDAADATVAAAFPNCDLCGIEMQYICWNCDNKLITPSSPPGRSAIINGAVAKAPLDQAILLLQSIQRTPSAKQLAMVRVGGVNRRTNNTSTPNSNNSFNKSDRSFSEGAGGGGGGPSGPHQPQQQQTSCDSLVGLDLSDCRLCKRQKTMHNYFGNGSSNLNNNNHSLLSSNATNNNYNNINNNNNNNTVVSNNNFNQGVSFNYPNINNNNNSSSNRRSSGSVFYDAVDSKMLEDDDDEVDEVSSKDRAAANYHRRTMSESLDVGNSMHSDDRGTDLTCRSADHRRETVLSEMELKMYRRAYSEDVLALGCDDDSPKDRLKRASDFYLHHHPLELSVDTSSISATGCGVPITCSPSSSLSAMSLEGTYKKPHPPSDGKPIPKVNLSRVFGMSSHPFDSAYSLNSLLPSPGSSATSIGLVMPATTEFIPVHKSNSAPSFQAANLLSPRFLKQAAIQKRRSRHLSDRSSERSSIGSDEPFSDEELGGGLDNTYIAMLSPVQTGDARVGGGLMRKVFPKSYPFGKRALLGSIEESLLQRRFVPKSHVPGFKVLLGASGGFCPTQLTIPSATSFYEMYGETLHTPYMCEIRIPRKGYSIPRKGTVQATLLNPLGMVVRMFVVAYDFRDMPALHQTFIRQRVLSSDNRGGDGDATHLSTAEQMKLLRYAIHLRFQTSRSGRLALHTDVRMLISRRTDCDTAAAHTKGVLESPNELRTVTVAPDSPKYSVRVDKI